MSAPYRKLDELIVDYAMLCRGCLAQSGEMKNIFEWGLADDFYECTNIQVQQSAGVSELLCLECENNLNISKRFKLQCQNSDTQLKVLSQEQQHSSIQSENEKHKNKQNTHQGTNHQNSVSFVLYDKKIVLLITAPNADEKIYLACPYCQSNYIKQKDLLAHLKKTHKKENDFDLEVQYYCHVAGCSYSYNSSKQKYFRGRKFLNQHYVKVHMDKTFHCKVCNMRFSTESRYNGHLKTCNVTFMCTICEIKYSCKERLLVHLLRKHPDLHKQYKEEKQALKRPSTSVTESKKTKYENDKLNDYICDSPKRSFATQTRPEDNIKNDVSLTSWQVKNDNYETKTDEISTQTVFEDLLSLKSQNSEDDSLFETVSLSDIQTQTFPLEFGLSRSNKETLTDQSVDLSIKETQTCFCLYDSPKVNYKLFEGVASSPCSLNLISSETQTSDLKSTVKSDVLLSFNSAETQTSFDEIDKEL